MEPSTRPQPGSMDAAADVCSKIVLAAGPGPVLVGIAGDSGSGKSHLTALLHARLKALGVDAVVVNHDDFLISRTEREPMKLQRYTSGEHAGKSHWEVLENMFRLDEFRRVLQGLRSGAQVSYYPYERSSGSVSSRLRVVEPAEVLLCDTSMLLDEMDLLIVIEVLQSTIIQRKLIRDLDVRTPEEITEMHQRVQGAYWKRCRPTYPDVVIDNNDPDAVSVEVRRGRGEHPEGKGRVIFSEVGE